VRLGFALACKASSYNFTAKCPKISIADPSAIGPYITRVQQHRPGLILLFNLNIRVADCSS